MLEIVFSIDIWTRHRISSKNVDLNICAQKVSILRYLKYRMFTPFCCKQIVSLKYKTFALACYWDSTIIIWGECSMLSSFDHIYFTFDNRFYNIFKFIMVSLTWGKNWQRLSTCILSLETCSLTSFSDTFLPSILHTFLPGSYQVDLNQI